MVGIYIPKKEVIDSLNTLKKQEKKPSDTLSQEILNSIFKQAGWK